MFSSSVPDVHEDVTTRPRSTPSSAEISRTPSVSGGETRWPGSGGGCRIHRALVVAPCHSDGHLSSCLPPPGASMCHHPATCGDGCLLTAGFLMVGLTREPKFAFVSRERPTGADRTRRPGDSQRLLGASAVLNPLSANLNGFKLLLRTRRRLFSEMFHAVISYLHCFEYETLLVSFSCGK